MLRTFHWIIVVLIFLLGLAHSYVALFCKHFNEESLWFFGSGMAIIFAGLFNLICLLNQSKAVRVVSILVNLVVTVLFVMALTVISEAQVYVGLILFAIATAFTILKSSF